MRKQSSAMVSLPERSTPVGCVEQDTFAINLDYCGNCRGKCKACLLSEEERMADVPLLTRAQIHSALEAVSGMAVPASNLIVGIGRGNVLTLPPGSINDIQAIAECVTGKFSFDQCLFEVSTSMIGKVDTQVERAKIISSAIDSVAKDRRLQTRFVVVINPEILSDGYWRNLSSFFSAMEEYRGGGDGSGDIAVINLTARSLPDVRALGERMKTWKFAINPIWVGGADIDDAEGMHPESMGYWLVEFLSISDHYGIHCSLKDRIENSMRYLGASQEDMIDEVERIGSCLAFVDAFGNVSYGAQSILGDLDRVRFPALAKEIDAKTEYASMLKWHACKRCEFIGACIAAGGSKIARINSVSIRSEDRRCPSGLKPLFLSFATV